MNINRWIKIRGKKFPFVETPISKQELSELQDEFRKFYLYDNKSDKISIIDSKRINHTYKIELGKRGMYWIIGSVVSIYILAIIKKTLKEKASKFNPFYTSPEMKEFLDNLNNPTPEQENVNAS